MDLQLTDKVAFVSGSGQGLGKCIVESFLEENAKVIITDIHEERLSATKQELSAKYDRSNIFCFKGDLTKDKDISTCVKESINRFGRIDFLVANLGSGRSVPDWNPPEEEWDRIIDLNFNGARRLTNSVVPYMIKQRVGAIVYISSIAGEEVIGAPINYSIAKASIIAYSKNLSFKLSQNNIRVNTVCPGNIFFENGTWDIKSRQNPQEVNEMLATKVPLKRFATPREIANIVLFLSSNKASYITGSCIIADGGQTISI